MFFQTIIHGSNFILKENLREKIIQVIILGVKFDIPNQQISFSFKHEHVECLSTNTYNIKFTDIRIYMLLNAKAGVDSNTIVIISKEKYSNAYNFFLLF